MKTLRIRVNDKVYDVTVEVVSDDDAPVATNGAPKTAPKATEGPRPAMPSSPVARSTSASAQSLDAVTAPIAGTIQKIFVQVGGHIEAKAPALLMDAMKMDTYIYAPRSGTIAKVAVNPGDAVRVGQLLFEYEEEA
ncbi:MAG TPA: hypothetical protein PLJ27_05970 [Polyangiaceae bacterium]|jgi:biotin carboxyl carrier protein|nr:MAG: Methylmalonyl-CoA carboxyltransferase 1.3S subunit [Deltaproteobacteria bacterium ADurb.Bin207]HNS97326.1 hypothetical protein [Polyangiaceae bacterium]HNZ23409.1 hypothetical protein [Polyangiaceae bacterium]HOD25170.1 hypothetical protein [Polyangiaceae bacterium]HOE49831.1 hypothetical protein [Polyangiaceae bacterium]